MAKTQRKGYKNSEFHMITPSKFQKYLHHLESWLCCSVPLFEEVRNVRRSMATAIKWLSVEMSPILRRKKYQCYLLPILWVKLINPPDVGASFEIFFQIGRDKSSWSGTTLADFCASIGFSFPSFWTKSFVSGFFLVLTKLEPRSFHVLFLCRQ